MSYSLRQGEKLSRGIRRIEKKQIKRIMKDFADRRPERRGQMVHAARKEIKKARSALRLARGGLRKAEYRKESRCLRDIGRAFSPWRDAEVVLKTVNKLRENCHDPRAGKVLAELAVILQKRRDEVFSRELAAPRIKSKLRTARQCVKEWHLGGLSRSDLISGSRRSYQRGRQAFQEAELTRAPENLHEWRKRVKGLWHQLRILRPSRPAVGAEYAREMKRLSDCLGDDHDLVMLQEAARNAHLGKRQMRLLAREVDSRRGKLQKKSFELGRWLFAGKPEVFARRIRYRGKKHRR